MTDEASDAEEDNGSELMQVVVWSREFPLTSPISAAMVKAEARDDSATLAILLDGTGDDIIGEESTDAIVSIQRCTKFVEILKTVFISLLHNVYSTIAIANILIRSLVKNNKLLVHYTITLFYGFKIVI